MTWLERALAVTPGAAQTRSKSPAAYGVGLAPHFASFGFKSRIWEEDTEHSLIDWVCGLGAISLGYQNGSVDDAIGDQLRRGTSFSLPTHLEAELGEQLREVVPCMRPDGMVRFVNSGSEACEAAVRIARKATGRDLVLVPKTGYHGWHSLQQAWKDEHPGVPESLCQAVQQFTYNDLASLDGTAAFRVAAILLEPTLFEAPAPGFLAGLRTLATRWGAALIFDECVTGFRLARAGGQERFCVTPDLACYGKGLGNGMPIALVCGNKELMQHADVVSGTFSGNALSLAAAKAVLEVYAKEDVCGHMERIGRELTVGLGAAGVCTGFDLLDLWEGAFDAVGKLRFRGLPPEQENRALGLFTQEMAAHGVLWHPRIRYVSLAHTEADVKLTVEAAGAAFTVVKAAVDSGDWSVLHGQPPDQPFARKEAPR